MKRKNRKKLLIIGVFAILLFCDFNGFLFWGSSYLYSLLVFGYFVERRALAELKQRPLPVYIISMTLVRVVTIAGIFFAYIPLVGYFHGFTWKQENYAKFLSNSTFYIVITEMMMIFILLSTISKIINKIGGKVLLNWLTGRYFKPKAERRIVAFFDIMGSVTICEKLGDRAYANFARDVINIICEATDNTGGTVSNFIGDGAVVCWPNRRKAFDRSFDCYFEILSHLNKKKNYFIQQFGEFPILKCGYHVGDLIVIEVGSSKSDFLIYGDAVNVTARLEGIANENKVRMIMSSEYVNGLDENRSKVSFLGGKTLKGKSESIEVYCFDEQLLLN